MKTFSRVFLTTVGFCALGALPTHTAFAHPLGNFTVNHLNELSVDAGGVTNNAIVDLAEIPTSQAQSSIDRDGDGAASTAEMAEHSALRCADLADRQLLEIDGVRVPFVVERAGFEYRPGEAGLSTSRLECRVRADADLTTPQSVRFRDEFEPDRVGWREVVVASGARVDVSESTVPDTSITNRLEAYPVELLTSPSDVTEATFDTTPSLDSAVVDSPLPTSPGQAAGTSPDEQRNADAARVDLITSRAGPLTRVVEKVEGVFDDLIGRRDLTWPVGLLAIALAGLLGASHALLPGHGKTIMAAYIAGRNGSKRDAVLVGATVTGTHTGGVLLLGLALTLSTGLAGEVVISWLGVASGLLVASLGVALLVGLIRGKSRFGLSLGQHSHGAFGHTHDHGQDDDHGHDHGHGHGHDHDHGHGHDHGDRHGAAHTGAARELSDIVGNRQLLARNVTVVMGSSSTTLVAPPLTTVPRSSAALPSITTTDVAGPRSTERTYSRLGLVGMGVAGGLVPSPSALIILLSAIALGRTTFGVLLVIAYGIGMAGTLTLAGVLLVVVRDRYLHTMVGRLADSGQRWTRFAPYATATLVLLVGLGLALRSATAL